MHFFIANKFLPLIETNIRQCGDISTSSLKMGRIIRELERLYGVRDGSAYKKPDPTMSTQVTQEVLERPLVVPNSQEKIAEMLALTKTHQFQLLWIG